MEKILIYGAGGAAKDIIRLVENTNQFEIVGIIVDMPCDFTSLMGYKILGDYKAVEKFPNIGVVIANGTPAHKKIMVGNLSDYNHLSYPNIIHPSVNLHHSNILHHGIVIEEGVVITTNVELKHFVSVNINSTISHDCVIERFTTISPQSAIAGNVRISEECFIGINSTIIEKLTVGKKSIVAAGAVVINNVPSNVLIGGVPAKVIKEI